MAAPDAPVPLTRWLLVGGLGALVMVGAAVALVAYRSLAARNAVQERPREAEQIPEALPTESAP